MITLELPPAEDDERAEDDWEVFRDAEDPEETTGFSRVLSSAVLRAEEEDEGPALDVRTFAELFPPLMAPDIVYWRRILTISPLGIDSHRLDALPLLEYHAWDALRVLEDEVIKNPLVLERPLPPTDVAWRRFTHVLKLFWGSLKDIKFRIVDYFMSEYEAYLETLHNLHFASNNKVDASETPSPMAFKRRERQVIVEKQWIKSLPGLEFLSMFDICRNCFNAQNLSLILVRAELKYNGSTVIEFSFQIISGISDIILRHVFYETNGTVRFAEEFSRQQVLDMWCIIE